MRSTGLKKVEKGKLCREQYVKAKWRHNERI